MRREFRMLGTDERVSCLVYGQGDPGQGADLERQRHHRFRIQLRDALRGAGVEADFAEDVLVLRPGEDVLWRQLELAQSRDFIVALQPPRAAAGPPTLKFEIADSFWDDGLRCRFYLLCAQDEPGYGIFEAYARRFGEQTFFYPEFVYQDFGEIVAQALHVAALVRSEKGAGRWPPRCGPPGPGHRRSGA